MLEKRVSRAILYTRDLSVLLGERVPGSHGAGKLALVGGKPESDETARQAVEREVWEELRITPILHFWKECLDTSSDPAAPWLVSYFYGLLDVSPVFNTNEIASIAYVRADDIARHPIAFDHADRLREFFDFLAQE